MEAVKRVPVSFFVLFTLVTALYTTTASEPEPCENYKVLNGSDRAMGNHDQSNVSCDRSLDNGWYRLQGDAGDQMPTSCVLTYRCGTHAPGWLQGQHPAVLNQTLTVKVCYHWSGNCCNWNNDIRVRKCSDYFVYEFVKPPAGCSLRYCGNKPAVTCPVLAAPPNGTRKRCDGNTTEMYSTVCQFSCDVGYNSSGSPVRRCLENGSWSGEDFSCEVVTCPALAAPTNGTRQGCDGNTTEMYDTVCQFSCAVGYNGSGSTVRRCLENGSWSGEDFECQVVTCPALAAPPNGTRQGCDGNTTEMYDTVCQFLCDVAYNGSGSAVRRCLENGSWSGEDFNCQVITCPVLVAPTNGTRQGCDGDTTEMYDTTCQFSCAVGYNGSGSTVRRCLENGTWNGEDFECQVVTCPELAAPSNGTRQGCDGNTTEMYGTVCQFSCAVGYNGSGSAVRRCLGNGTWSGEEYICRVVTCPVLAAPSNGTRQGCDGNTTEMYDKVCQFSCAVGYNGSGSTVRRCLENGTWSGEEYICRANTCSPPCLLLSRERDILALELETSTFSLVVSGLARSRAIDVHFSLGYLFWSDVLYKNIKRSQIDGTDITVIIDNSGVCEGLAVDWISSTLYWTDATNKTISMSDLEGNNRLVLVSSEHGRPVDIAVDPKSGSIFWTDWGKPPKIERASLNGNQRVVIVTQNLILPEGIDLDRVNQRIFWVDASADRVESADYSGNARTLLFQGGTHLFGVAFFPPFLLLTDLSAYVLNVMNVTNGTIVNSYNTSTLPWGVAMYDSSLQPSVFTCPP